jgi:hypothetical protein
MGNELSVLVNQPLELTFLGETGICKYTEKGILKGIDVTVKLYLSKNHIYAQKMGGGQNAAVSYKITSEGYEHINKFANLQEVYEPKIDIGGKEYPNPYIHLDEFGKKDKVYQKVTLAGRDTNGDIKFSTAVILSDASDMVISEISNKLKYDDAEALGYYSTYEDYVKDKETTSGLKYIALDEDSGVVIKLRSKEYRGLKANVDDKRATIERKTHTVAKRNAFRKHPATSYYTVTPAMVKDAHGGGTDLVATVRVIKWVNQRVDELESEIKSYLANKQDDNYTEKITDTDDEYSDLEEGQELPDDYVTIEESINIVKESVLESVACSEDEVERQQLIKFINESFLIFPDLKRNLGTPLEVFSITELHALKHEINKIADGGTNA